MKLRAISRKTLYFVLLTIVTIPLFGCASLHPSPNGPGDCVGPPDYCIPYFGS